MRQRKVSNDRSKDIKRNQTLNFFFSFSEPGKRCRLINPYPYPLALLLRRFSLFVSPKRGREKGKGKREIYQGIICKQKKQKKKKAELRSFARPFPEKESKTPRSTESVRGSSRPDGRSMRKKTPALHPAARWLTRRSLQCGPKSRHARNVSLFSEYAILFFLPSFRSSKKPQITPQDLLLFWLIGWINICRVTLLWGSDQNRGKNKKEEKKVRVLTPCV